MNIIGISKGHDASVALVRDGKIVFNIQEERLVGIKHSFGIPVNGLDLLLRETGLAIRDIDAVAIPIIGKIPDMTSLFHAQQDQIVSLASTSVSPQDILRNAILNAIGYLNVFNRFGYPVYQKIYPIKEKTKIYQVDHHASHAASAYYCSGFNRSLVVTADGVGAGLSITAWLGENGTFTPLTKIWRPGSLGFFYEIVTEALGWQVGDGEGKTMGLAPYGTTKKTKGVLDFLAPVYREGKLVRPVNFGIATRWDINGATHFSYALSRKVKKLADRFGRENIAAEAQRVLEEQMINFVVPWIKKTNARYLAAAGGVFLNVKMNQRIWETRLLDDFYPHADPGDGGNAAGAALYVYHEFLKKPYKPARILNTYWGPQYPDEFIKKQLDVRNLSYEEVKDSKARVALAAKLLCEGKIIGWFQGRLETGPRALGNRSILIDPRRAENKDIINARVKYREAFRPFCPSMTDTAGKIYLDRPTRAEFMTISFDVPEDRRDDIPAVVHVDATARPQILKRAANPLYYDLIAEFGRLTGVPVLLNTSFNIKGMPIVCTPADAIKCFYDTGLDYLFIGSYVLKKNV